MSLLYEALLKNNKNKSASATYTEKSAEDVNESFSKNKIYHSDFLTNSENMNAAQADQFSINKFTSVGNNVQQGNKHIPSLVWFLIASLLLVVGLLAGYIYGNALLANNTPLDKSAKVITAPVDVIETVELGSNENKTLNANDQKTVEIALDSTGRVVSKVSELNQKPSATNKDEQTSSESVKAKISQEKIEEPQLSDEQVALNNVPDKLKATFAEAIKATEKAPMSDESFKISLSQSSDLLMLDDLTGYQVQSLPDLIYQMHIFSSEISERWVRINGKTLYEGYELQDGLTLLEIKQDLIVWRFNNIKVGQLALVDFIK
jgi:hypothetical protein